MKTFFQFFYEKYSDLGKLSPEQLTKGQRLDPQDSDNFKQVDGRVFYNVLTNIMNSDLSRKIPKNIKKNLTLYPLVDYRKMKCFLGKNNSSGYCIKDGDELVSVFSSQGSSGNALVQDAIKEGARRLDCFATQDGQGGIVDEGLYKLYKRNGFVIDESVNMGGEYPVQNGISYFVNDAGEVDPTNPTIVIFMRLNR